MPNTNVQVHGTHANQGPGTTSWWDYIVLSSAPPVPGLIFIDSFELGNMSAWSLVVGWP
jgi:hypothetical protein